MKAAVADVVDTLLAGLAPSPEELRALRALEASGKADEFAKAMRALDKRQALWRLDGLKGLDPKLLSRRSFVPVRARGLQEQAPKPIDTVLGQPNATWSQLLAQLLEGHEITNETLVPLTFRAVKSYVGMSGPDVTDVREGLLGANRLHEGEYTLRNGGDTSGTTRIPWPGHIMIDFSTRLPKAGRYYVVNPAGTLWIKGHSRVIGEGNATTCYDAKAWVHFYLEVCVEGNLEQIAGAQIHYDGTRSEDRTKQFREELVIEPQSVLISANAGDELVVRFRLQVDTEANEDGAATVVVNYFGFPANRKNDYDTVVAMTE